MKYLLQKSFALAALSLMGVQPVFAMTQTEAEANCTKMKGQLTVTQLAVGASYVCKVGGKVVFSETGTATPKPTTTPLATTPVVPRAGLIYGGKLWLTPSRSSYQNARLVTRPGVVGASLEVTCGGGKTYEISTGTSGGSCGVDTDSNGTVTGGSCGTLADSSNGASMTCSQGCTGSSGSGSCGTKP